MLRHEPFLNRSDQRLHRLKLRRQHDEAGMCIDRKARISIDRNDRQQLLGPFAPLRSYNAKLSQVCPHGIDHLGSLSHQQIADPMLHQSALLLRGLNPHKAHGRPTHGLADRLGVGSIVLVALDVGLHVLRRHQPHLMAELREFTRPIMCRRAGFHADKTRCQRLEERQHLTAPKLLPDNDLFVAIYSVNLEYVLGTWNTFLAISKPIVVTCIWTAPLM